MENHVILDSFFHGGRHFQVSFIWLNKNIDVVMASNRWLGLLVCNLSNVFSFYIFHSFKYYTIQKKILFLPEGGFGYLTMVIHTYLLENSLPFTIYKAGIYYFKYINCISLHITLVFVKLFGNYGYKQYILPEQCEILSTYKTIPLFYS